METPLPVLSNIQMVVVVVNAGQKHQSAGAANWIDKEEWWSVIGSCVHPKKYWVKLLTQFQRMWSLGLSIGLFSDVEGTKTQILGDSSPHWPHTQVSALF